MGRKRTPNRLRTGLSRDKLAGVPQILDDVHRRFATAGDYEPDPAAAEANAYHIAAATREIRRRDEARRALHAPSQETAGHGTE